MFGIGMPELIVILVIGLILLGPKKLPGITKAIGKGIREFKRSIYSLDTTDAESESQQKNSEESEK